MKPSQDIHVLLTTDSVGGVWTFALDLIEATRARGVRFTLACLGPAPSREQIRAVQRMDGVTLRCCPGRLEWMDDPWDDVDGAGRRLRQIADEEQPDVVHLNSYSIGAEPFDAPVLMTAHSCVLSWWRAVRRTEAPRRWSRYARRVLEGIGGADHFVAPTQAMLDEMRRLYAPLPPSEVIANGRCRAQRTVRPKEPMIASVGRVWDEAKNIECVARAARSLPWRCVVAGDAASPDGRAASFDDVLLLGRIGSDQVWDLLERSSILAHPARYEPFGLTPLEAALCDCALVLGDIPTLREIWDDAAIYVDPEDADALAREIRALIDDEPRRADMARRARTRAARFSENRFGQAYADVYAGLAALSRAGTVA